MSDLWNILRADHDQIWAMVSRLTRGSGGPRGTPQRQRRTARERVAVAASHDAAEDLVIWPAVGRLRAAGAGLAARAGPGEPAEAGRSAS